MLYLSLRQKSTKIYFSMKKNSSLIIFEGKEMYRLLLRNPNNRAVSPEDYKNNSYFAPSSMKRASKRVKDLVKKIQNEGWYNIPVRAYRTEDGYFILLDGNNRREALEICVREGILTDYPEWDVTDMSCRINSRTGKPYTFEEAMDEVEYSNIHAQKAHTATDIIEAHAGTGSEICQEICTMANKYGMSTTLVSDLLTGIRGSSTEENVERIIETSVDEERRNDVEKLLEMLDVMDKNRPEDVTKTFKESHSVYAFENVYKFCKSYGVADEFCALMKSASKCRKPNPFKGFFDCKKTNVHVDQILYLLEGFFARSASKEIRVNVNKIVSAFERGGAMNAIANFRLDLKFKNNAHLVANKKVA